MLEDSMTRSLVWLPLVVALSGCVSTVLDQARFERECITPAQCRPVTYGDQCTGCQCANGAANEQGYAKWELEKKSISCRSPPPACPCSAPLVACVNDLCVLQ
jgi:hypothetical protein